MKRILIAVLAVLLSGCCIFDNSCGVEIVEPPVVDTELGCTLTTIIHTSVPLVKIHYYVNLVTNIYVEIHNTSDITNTQMLEWTTNYNGSVYVTYTSYHENGDIGGVSTYCINLEDNNNYTNYIRYL